MSNEERRNSGDRCGVTSTVEVMLEAEKAVVKSSAVDGVIRRRRRWVVDMGGGGAAEMSKRMRE